MKKLSFITMAIGGIMAMHNHAYAQPLTDRFDDLFKRASLNNADFRSDIKQFNTEINQRVQAMNARNNAVVAVAKTTGSRGTIPVIFHIVLDSAKMKQIGDAQEIEKRIKGQLEVLNADFNALNADSTTIPGAFKPLYSSLNVSFGLAHTDPAGKYTKGYEIIYTTKKGFDENNLTAGSQFACSDAKFAVSGGIEAWDTKKYYNIWIINILPTGIGGIGTPPPYALYGGTALLPFEEQGTVISYMAFGKKEDASQYFPIPSAQVGRTLVHETGHFMNLFHPFGMSTLDNSSCTDDDGVTDTPPEAGPSMGKPVFPHADVCSPAAPGVMNMNHMDYSDDGYRVIYTKGQTDRMAVEFEPGGYRYDLLQHPELLNAPTGITDMELNNPLHIWPNPVSNICHITLSEAGHKGELIIINTMGQLLKNEVINRGSYMQIDMSSYPAGTYIVKYISDNNVYTEKVVKQ